VAAAASAPTRQQQDRQHGHRQQEGGPAARVLQGYGAMDAGVRVSPASKALMVCARPQISEHPADFGQPADGGDVSHEQHQSKILGQIGCPGGQPRTV
jgi:hypothetical protein